MQYERTDFSEESNNYWCAMPIETDSNPSWDDFPEYDESMNIDDSQAWDNSNITSNKLTQKSVPSSIPLNQILESSLEPFPNSPTNNKSSINKSPEDRLEALEAKYSLLLAKTEEIGDNYILLYNRYKQLVENNEDLEMFYTDVRRQYDTVSYNYSRLVDNYNQLNLKFNLFDKSFVIMTNNYTRIENRLHNLEKDELTQKSVPSEFSQATPPTEPTSGFVPSELTQKSVPSELTQKSVPSELTQKSVPSDVVNIRVPKEEVESEFANKPDSFAPTEVDTTKMVNGKVLFDYNNYDCIKLDQNGNFEVYGRDIELLTMAATQHSTNNRISIIDDVGDEIPHNLPSGHKVVITEIGSKEMNDSHLTTLDNKYKTRYKFHLAYERENYDS